MTVHVDIHEAQQRFLELIQAAARGEEIVITKDTFPLVQMTAAQEDLPQPTFGSARGLITMSDDFDAPLDDFHEYMP